MDELIEIVNQLQDVFAASNYTGIDLPQIVVVGSQSSGKSSVLEHIVGKSFLPRGTGIVTRCPLILQLAHASASSSEEEVDEYAVFQHDKNKTFTDYTSICQEIQAETDRLAGENKGICHTSINLKWYSPSFLNLTLVDLPGLTKVPVGDQPYDIEEQTKELTLKYIKNPKSIILAVTPANVDMATSESLKIARDVDPKGERTLAVLTKLDLMDQGTDAWDMLSGKVIPVKLGIIGVVNRSQKDIQDKKAISESLKDEAEFLKKQYKSIAKFHGSNYLTKKVQGVLVNHVKSCMPELRQKIQEKLQIKTTELNQLKDTKLDKSTILLDLITKFSSTFTSAVKGNVQNIQTKELYGGARIKYVFQKGLTKALKSFDPVEGLTKTHVLTAMQNASGVNSAIFVPEIAFELLVKMQIEKLRNPSLRCVDLVYKEMCRILQDCLEDPTLGLDRYPRIPRELDVIVNELLRSRLPITNEMIDDLMDVELAYMNTSHPDFLPNTVQNLKVENSKGDSNLSNQCVEHIIDDQQSLPQKGVQWFNSLLAVTPGQDRDSRDFKLIKELIISYFKIVQKTIQDTIPKIIMHFLVNFVVNRLQVELVVKLYHREADDLLEESTDVVEKREELKAEVAALEKANDIISTLLPIASRRKT